MEIHITLKAEIVKTDPGTGLVTLAIEGVPMDRDLHRALVKHFPHCGAEVEQMVAREALISAVESEVE